VSDWLVLWYARYLRGALLRDFGFLAELESEAAAADPERSDGSGG
jgi:hypothetical protein